MLCRVIAYRQGKKGFYVFYGPMILRIMDISIKFLIMQQTVPSLFLTRET